MLKYMNDNSGECDKIREACLGADFDADVWQGALWWAAGPWWGDYMYGLEPTNGVAYNAYMPILQSAFAVSGSNPTTTIATTTTRATTTTTRATTATTTSRVTSTGTTSLPSPTGACAARFGQCGVSLYMKPYEENGLGLTHHRATDGAVRRAVRADRLAPRRTTGTRNVCRRDENRRIHSSYGVPIPAASEQCPHWYMLCMRGKLRIRPSLCSYLVGDSFTQISMCHSKSPDVL